MTIPVLDTDRDIVLDAGDRVGISHRQSVWPFQYRFGANLTSELQEMFREQQDRGIHHAHAQTTE